MRVFGIDPGLTRCGIGVVEVDDARKVKFVHVSVVKTEPDLAIHFRIRNVANHIRFALEEMNPEIVAIERVFVQDNLQSVTPTTQVMGAAMAEVGRANLPLAMYTPSEVKAAVTGAGNASKTQIQHMVARILQLRQAPKPADAADALAIAITHAWKGTGVVGAREDGTFQVSLSGKVRSKGNLTPAQKRWAQAAASHRRSGAVDPHRN